MPIIVLTGPTIRAGESLSEALDVSNGGIFRVMMPDDWNTANITFQLSQDGVKFYNMYDKSGNEVIVRCIAKSIVPLEQYVFYVHSIKIRSGTMREPIAQEADREFALVLDDKSTMMTDVPISTSSMLY